MTIHLPAELEQFVHDQVLAGAIRPTTTSSATCLEQLRKHAPTPTTGTGSIGIHARGCRFARPGHPGHHGRPPQTDVDVGGG